MKVKEMDSISRTIIFDNGTELHGIGKEQTSSYEFNKNYSITFEGNCSAKVTKISVTENNKYKVTTVPEQTDTLGHGLSLVYITDTAPKIGDSINFSIS